MSLTSKEAEVARTLEKNGWKDVPSDLLKEFVRSLKEESSDPNYSDDSEKNQKKKANILPKPKKTMLPKRENKEDTVITDGAKKSPPKRVLAPPIQLGANENSEDDDEELKWNEKMRNIKEKAESLDNSMKECRDMILNPQNNVTDDVDVPIYYGSSERKLDPYPTVKRELTGGFIRPPPTTSGKKKRISPKKAGRRLLYEERHPESSYIPPPERRRDALRWSIRQKLIYSHPDYQK